MSEWEKRLERPSVPLMAKGPPGPPRIVEIEKKYSAIEGTDLFSIFLMKRQYIFIVFPRALEAITKSLPYTFTTNSPFHVQ